MALRRERKCVCLCASVRLLPIMWACQGSFYFDNWIHFGGVGFVVFSRCCFFFAVLWRHSIEDVRTKQTNRAVHYFYCTKEIGDGGLAAVLVLNVPPCSPLTNRLWSETLNDFPPTPIKLQMKVLSQSFLHLPNCGTERLNLKKKD